MEDADLEKIVEQVNDGCRRDRHLDWKEHYECGHEKRSEPETGEQG